MKIVIVTNHSYMLYRFRKELIESLLEDNDVTLLMPFVGHEDDFASMGCKCIETAVDRRGINPVTDLFLVKKYISLLKEEKPDYVITYSIKPNVYAGIACQLLSIPYYANVQGLGTAFQKPVLASFVTMLYKFAFRKVRCVFFENTTNRQEFLDRNIVDMDTTHVLNGAGVNLENFSSEVLPETDKLHFIFVGRIMKEKGVDELVDACSKLHAINNNVVLDVVGLFEDDYEERIQELSKNDWFHFHGFQQTVKPFLEKAHCLVLPSYHEGMANTPLEAASMKRAVIVSNIPGCKEGVLDGVSGYLVNVKDSHDLFLKMKQFSELSYDEQLEMGVQGRRYMEEKFDKRKVVEDTINTIKRRG